jgi:hypothetical protein
MCNNAKVPDILHVVFCLYKKCLSQRSLGEGAAKVTDLGWKTGR